MNPPTQPELRFVPPGTLAPVDLPPGEIWLDVGGRAEVGVLDHHGGDADQGSSCALVLAHHDDLLRPAAPDGVRLALVLHAAPDLDAIAASWLAVRLLADPALARDPALRDLVRRIGESDQGFASDDALRDDWIVVMKTRIELAGGDRERVNDGWKALDETVTDLQAGHALSAIARRLTTPPVRVVLTRAVLDYRDDLRRATRFQLGLPVRRHDRRPPSGSAAPLPAPDPASERWALTDGLFLPEPRSTLFKELARADRTRSFLGEGFGLLVTSRELPEGDAPCTRTRHVISTAPESGLHLQGLGPRLERLEKDREDALGAPLPAARRRGAAGSGRHGHDVPSPWYDGRGHDHTIIDGPVVKDGGRDVCGSLLGSADVLEAIWEYGDPARLVRLTEADLHVIRPVSLDTEDLPDAWRAGPDLGDLHPGLSAEIRRTFGGPDSEIRMDIRRGPEGRADLPAGVAGVTTTLWSIAPGLHLWVGHYELGDGIRDLRGLGEAIRTLRESAPAADLLPGLALRDGGEAYHVVQTRVAPGDMVFSDEPLATLQVMHRLAMGESSRFGDLATDRELDDLRRVTHSDRLTAAYVGARGLVTVTGQPRHCAAPTRPARSQRPVVLAVLSLLQRESLQRLEDEFAHHRAHRDTARANRRILASRWHVLFIKQFFLFTRVSEQVFEQGMHEALASALALSARRERTFQKVEDLARQIQESRAGFYQKIAYWITLLFMPLGITASFFSGTHMQREFAATHELLLPVAGRWAGWAHFGFIFLLLVLASLLIWGVVGLVRRRQDTLERTRRGR